MSIAGTQGHGTRGRRGAFMAGALAIGLALVGTGSTVVSAADEAYTLELTPAAGDLPAFLTGEGGMTLYYFTKDVTPGVSVCEGKCLEAWPPLLLEMGETVAAGEGVSGVVGTIVRADGTTQATYDGRPLYYFFKDEKAGDTTGQAAGGVWWVAAEDGSVPPPVQVSLGLAAAAGDLPAYLTGKDGMTLYYFTKDVTPGVTTCYEDCAKAWPPLLLAGNEIAVAGDGVTGVIGSVPRTDGGMQVTYDGRPLYYFAADAAAGDTTGQGKGGVWFVAAEDGSVPAE